MREIAQVLRQLLWRCLKPACCKPEPTKMRSIEFFPSIQPQILQKTSCHFPRPRALFYAWVVVNIMVPFWGTLNIRCRIILGVQKVTIILTTTHMSHEYGRNALKNKDVMEELNPGHVFLNIGQGVFRRLGGSGVQGLAPAIRWDRPLKKKGACYGWNFSLLASSLRRIWVS